MALPITTSRPDLHLRGSAPQDSAKSLSSNLVLLLFYHSSQPAKQGGHPPRVQSEIAKWVIVDRKVPLRCLHRSHKRHADMWLGLHQYLVRFYAQAQGFPHPCCNKGPVQRARPKATTRGAPRRAHRAPTVTIVINTPATTRIRTLSFIHIRMVITTTLMTRNR